MAPPVAIVFHYAGGARHCRFHAGRVLTSTASWFCTALRARPSTTITDGHHQLSMEDSLEEMKNAGEVGQRV